MLLVGGGGDSVGSDMRREREDREGRVTELTRLSSLYTSTSSCLRVLLPLQSFFVWTLLPTPLSSFLPHPLPRTICFPRWAKTAGPTTAGSSPAPPAPDPPSTWTPTAPAPGTPPCPAGRSGSCSPRARRPRASTPAKTAWTWPPRCPSPSGS